MNQYGPAVPEVMTGLVVTSDLKFRGGLKYSTQSSNGSTGTGGRIPDSGLIELTMHLALPKNWGEFFLMQVHSP
jgi:hypothetical protein